MKRNTGYVCVAAMIMLALAAFGGCSKGAKKGPTAEPAPPVSRPVEPLPTPQAEQPAPIPVKPAAELEDIFFEYDKHDLRPDALAILRRNGQILMEQPDMKILIEGHCDERGTIEYNLALGDRRARAARDFLVDYGVRAARIQTISYGEERPFVKGSDEAAWSQNRRDHFVQQP
jgi:peptidoglycan-associated lipoprotein